MIDEQQPTEPEPKGRSRGATIFIFVCMVIVSGTSFNRMFFQESRSKQQEKINASSLDFHDQFTKETEAAYSEAMKKIQSLGKESSENEDPAGVEIDKKKEAGQ